MPHLLLTGRSYTYCLTVPMLQEQKHDLCSHNEDNDQEILDADLQKAASRHKIDKIYSFLLGIYNFSIINNQ